jgi:hypothetical protein
VSGVKCETFSILSLLTHRTPDEQMALEEMCSNLIRDLDEYGVCVLDSFIGEERGKKVLGEVKSMYSAGLFRVSRVESSSLNGRFILLYPRRTDSSSLRPRQI